MSAYTEGLYTFGKINLNNIVVFELAPPIAPKTAPPDKP